MERTHPRPRLVCLARRVRDDPDASGGSVCEGRMHSDVVGLDRNGTFLLTSQLLTLEILDGIKLKHVTSFADSALIACCVARRKPSLDIAGWPFLNLQARLSEDEEEATMSHDLGAAPLGIVRGGDHTHASFVKSQVRNARISLNDYDSGRRQRFDGENYSLETTPEFSGSQMH